MASIKDHSCYSSTPTIFYLILLPCFLVIIFSKNYSMAVSSYNYSNYDTRYKQVSSLRLARIQRHLNKINKPPLFTIQSPDGDVIDCVLKRKQPALDHPLLKNHKIQRVRPEIPKTMRRSKTDQQVLKPKTNNTTTTLSVDGFKGVWQMWHREGRFCPKGTVPVRRSTVHDVLRAKSLHDFGKKQTSSMPLDPSRPQQAVIAPDVSGYAHEHAIAYTSSSSSGDIYGAKATINVWDPSVEAPNEFSLSQIWVLSGSFDGSDLNSIEAGWQVSPELYGDTRPRLFTYWTSDAYQATGCYNLLCSGFVQTSSRIAIGAAISPVSSINGEQYEITLLIWKDPKSGNWWMGFGDGTLVGYWPTELFTHLVDRATMVEWGGEIVNTRHDNEHTTTQMGSGHFAKDGFGKASFFRNLGIVDSENSLNSVQDMSTLAENAYCYDIQSSYDDAWRTHFYYGGPGRSPQCP